MRAVLEEDDDDSGSAPEGVPTDFRGPPLAVGVEGADAADTPPVDFRGILIDVDL